MKNFKNINEYYNYLIHRKSDIGEHLPTLLKYGKMVDHITEFGVRWGNSTIAFLHANPKRMISYDIDEWGRYEEVKPMIEKIDFTFVRKSTLDIDIEETDLLFIDTYHSYDQLSKELILHGDKARKYIIFHDTVTFGIKGMDNKEPGLLQAIDEFKKDTWFVKEKFTNNNGLLILERK